MIPQASASSAQGTNPVNGRNGGPNYVTMADPAKSDFSTVIVNDSEQAQTHRITPQNLRLGRNPELSVWQTTAAAQDEQFDANFKQHVADVRPDDQGAYEVEVAPYSVVSVTSLDVERDEAWTTALPVEGERTVLGEDDEVLFSDDYDYRRKKVATIDHRGKVSRRTESFIDSRGGEEGAIPLYTWARNGAFEAHRADDGEWVLRQQLDTAEGIGGAGNGGDPVAAVGDRHWTDYRASVDVGFETESTENNYAALGARNSGGGSSHKISGTPYTIQLSATGDWTFARLGETIAEGSIEDWQADPKDWHELQLEVVGNRVTASIDDRQLVEHTDDEPYLSGWVDLASGPHHTQFDNLQVERIDDQAAHYDRYLDDLEMAELDDPGEELLRYDGEWSHANGESMYTYGRTASVTEDAGSGLQYTFDGTGLDLIGANDGSARLRVSVDGEVVEQEASTVASGDYQQTYSLRDLEPGRHTVRIELLSGSLKVDAVGTVGAR
ncbi:hypothetical protein [Naumannella halotolerans]|uniref:Glycosyl hydrolase family 59 C-terminal lectin domain-containing protein n=1 Tax=Naumannella halotolerans TaxID=993414 RepID=A0A4R7J7R6_9ACTN|nr:hypothetical protein CLV29_0902 [Naumannella halotolerans]